MGFQEFEVDIDDDLAVLIEEAAKESGKTFAEMASYFLTVGLAIRRQERDESQNHPELSQE